VIQDAQRRWAYAVEGRSGDSIVDEEASDLSSERGIGLRGSCRFYETWKSQFVCVRRERRDDVKEKTYETTLMKPIFASQTLNHTLTLLHRIIRLPPLTSAKLPFEVLAVFV
jgi:hypothetical protein